MPRNVKLPENCIKKYVSEARRSSKKRTYDQYQTVLLKITNDLRNNGFDPSPYHMDERIIQFLLDVIWKNKEVSTRRWNTYILSRYLKFYKNKTIEKMDLKWPQDMRPNVDWLEDDETALLLNSCKTTLEEVVIHLELCMGLRIAEVCKLRVKDVHFGRMPYIDILGKGKGDGKWRSVYFHEDSEELFLRWLVERSEIINSVKKCRPNWTEPEEFLIWTHYKNKPDAGPFSPTGHSIDRAVIHKVRERLGIQFTNHTLRRTFGRMLYHADVPVATISNMLGHDDIATTLLYIGVNMDDMSLAMGKLAIYQKSIKCNKLKKEVSQH